MSVVRDRHDRPLRSLRVSVTDRCNLRCAYCMPEEDYSWLPRAELLTFEEIERLVRRFASLGVTRLRLTGGEPLLRRDLPDLVARLARIPALEDLALTTNGVLLDEQAAALRAAGLQRLTVSLDTLRADRFRRLTRRRSLDRVLGGIEAAERAGFPPPKIDTVLLRGVNDDEVDALLAWARSFGGELRFIEYMDVGGATRWSASQVVSRAELLAGLRRRHGSLEPAAKQGWAPADRFRLPDGQVFGIISSTTEPFCATCDRSRLTADGRWYHCLYARTGTDLRAPLRAGADDEELEGILERGWRARADRGAEERATTAARGPVWDLDALQRDPRLEMHTRGG